MIEELALNIAGVVANAIEIVAVAVIAWALVKVLVSFIRLHIRADGKVAYRSIRVEFGGAVSLALELLLGADVVQTAVAPTWEDIGKLAAIAALRTALNYFLERDLRLIEKEEPSR